MTVGDKLLLSIPEAASRLSIGRTSLYRLIVTGEIRTIKLGRRTVISVEELQRFVSQLQSSS